MPRFETVNVEAVSSSGESRLALRARDEIARLGRDGGERLGVRVDDRGHEQRILRGHRDADVDPAVALAPPVDERAVERGVLPQRERDGLDDEVVHRRDRLDELARRRGGARRSSTCRPARRRRTTGSPTATASCGARSSGRSSTARHRGGRALEVVSVRAGPAGAAGRAARPACGCGRPGPCRRARTARRRVATRSGARRASRAHASPPTGRAAPAEGAATRLHRRPRRCRRRSGRRRSPRARLASPSPPAPPSRAIGSPSAAAPPSGTRISASTPSASAS